MEASKQMFYHDLLNNYLKSVCHTVMSCHPFPMSASERERDSAGGSVGSVCTLILQHWGGEGGGEGGWQRWYLGWREGRGDSEEKGGKRMLKRKRRRHLLGFSQSVRISPLSILTSGPWESEWERRIKTGWEGSQRQRQRQREITSETENSQRKRWGMRMKMQEKVKKERMKLGFRKLDQMRVVWKWNVVIYST